MTGNQVVSTMFDFNTCNHMARFVLSGDGIEDSRSHLFLARLQWSMYDLYRHIDPLCMSHGYVIIQVLSHRSTVYSWWLCSILTTWIHSV
jgi:hypothetical protein